MPRVGADEIPWKYRGAGRGAEVHPERLVTNSERRPELPVRQLPPVALDHRHAVLRAEHRRDIHTR